MVTIRNLNKAIDALIEERVTQFIDKCVIDINCDKETMINIWNSIDKDNPARRGKSKKKGVKRSRSAYVNFCSKYRSGIMARGLKFGDTSKELAKIWKEMTLEEKNKYISPSLEPIIEVEEESMVVSIIQKTGRTDRSEGSRSPMRLTGPMSVNDYQEDESNGSSSERKSLGKKKTR